MSGAAARARESVASASGDVDRERAGGPRASDRGRGRQRDWASREFSRAGLGHRFQFRFVEEAELGGGVARGGCGA